MADQNDYIRDLFDDLKYSVSKFDAQALAISGGALGISLTFIKDIVPFEKSSYIGFFYCALILFVLSIIIGFFGHYHSLKIISKSLKLASQNRHTEIKEDKVIPRINLFLITSLILGIIFLVAYCIINIQISKKNNSKSDVKILTIETHPKTGATLKIDAKVEKFNYLDTVNNSTLINIK
jgi:hypothetical protein